MFSINADAIRSGNAQAIDQAFMSGGFDANDLYQAAVDTSSNAAPDDPSKPIHFHQKFVDGLEVEMALGLYCELNGVSRQGWDKLREILFLLKGPNSGPLSEIKYLPKQL